MLHIVDLGAVKGVQIEPGDLCLCGEKVVVDDIKLVNCRQVMGFRAKEFCPRCLELDQVMGVLMR